MPTSAVAEPSVTALRAEAEANRARLTGTVEDLRTQVADTATDLKERLSPSAIKAEVTDYVRDSRDQLWHTLEQKARDNPLQAVAVGAAVAYPAFQLLRAMPAPLLLVGAGLLLSRTTGKSTAISNATEVARDRTQGAMDSVSSAVDNATDTARRKLHDAQDYARDGAETVMERGTALASSVKDRVAEATDSAKAAVGDTTDKVMSQAEDFTRQAREAVATTWDQNPLLVAGAGLVIGAVIAAAFPSTETEENLFGEASDAMRREAERTGVNVARTAVEGVVGAATDEGLSVDGLKKAGEHLTDKVRAVAAKGVEAALGETKPAPTNTQLGKTQP
jgi:ElaB/YqjD/DUF883 family membrane-anchored ribosome-binding protein